METMEIILLVAGGVIFTLSFFIPDKRGASGGKGLSREDIQALVEQELAGVGHHVDDTVEEAVTYAMEKTERSLERLTNEKIMAVNEYSDTVLTEIHKNHEEAVFLYDMLNNKHTSLKNTASEINAAVREAEGAMLSLEQMLAERPDTVKGIGEAPSWNLPEAAYDGQAAEQESIEYAGPEQDEWSEDGSQEYNNNEKILRLYKQGKSALMIAKELELGIGEVSLVIDLFRKQA